MSGTGIAESQRDALRYLHEQLGDRAPAALCFEGQFDESPLDGEGRTSLFSFTLDAPAAASGCGDNSAHGRHYVVVGHTESNYFPGYELGPDDAYSFHVGTRFMLELSLQRVDVSLEPPGARDELRRFVQQYAFGARVEREELAALFRCDEGYFAVYRLALDGQDVYCLGADCPPGFYRMTQHPPQAALRLHLGKQIRAEARRARAAGET